MQSVVISSSEVVNVKERALKQSYWHSWNKTRLGWLFTRLFFPLACEKWSRNKTSEVLGCNIKLTPAPSAPPQYKYFLHFPLVLGNILKNNCIIS